MEAGSRMSRTPPPCATATTAGCSQGLVWSSSGHSPARAPQRRWTRWRTRTSRTPSVMPRSSISPPHKTTPAGREPSDGRCRSPERLLRQAARTKGSQAAAHTTHPLSRSARATTGYIVLRLIVSGSGVLRPMRCAGAQLQPQVTTFCHHRRVRSTGAPTP